MYGDPYLPNIAADVVYYRCMENACNEKKLARKRFKMMRDTMDAAERKLADEAICRAIVNSEEFKNARILFAYFPIGSEVDIRPVIEQAWRHGMSVAFPKTDDGRIMDWYKVESFRELQSARFGLSEPPADPKTLVCSPHKGILLDANTPALVLVPGLAFDIHGYRLGYGGGYYDTFLSALKSASCCVYALGVVRKNCIVDDLDALSLIEDHDIQVDALTDGAHILTL